jgi:two-component system response regulator YesN
MQALGGMKVYKVLIVDDEPWIVYGLKNLIDWETLGFKVIGEAYNGVTALEMILKEKPDVVISDIRMPGLNGIELIEKMKQEGLDTATILISGYSEFEYARKAINLGAFDYLLKQVNQKELTDTLLRLKQHLNRTENALKRLDLSLDDIFELLDPVNKVKINNFLASKDILFDLPHYRYINCLYPHTTVSGGAEEIVSFGGMQYIRFRTGQNKSSYLINYDELNNPLELLNFVTEKLADAEHIGISSIGIFSTSIAKLYQESDIALFSFLTFPEQKLIEYKETDNTAFMSEKIFAIEAAIKEHNQAKIRDLLDEICESCKTEQVYIEQLANVYNQIVSLIYKFYSKSEAIHEIEYLHYSQITRFYSRVEQLFDWIKTFFDQQPGEEIQVSNELLRKIIEYMDNHYTEDILLSTLSKKFNISLGYLSGLIKKETGITYSEYVINKRLNLAKELFKDHSLSIQDIVHRVGYKDYFHFNKLFKKHIGITPGKYRKI